MSQGFSSPADSPAIIRGLFLIILLFLFLWLFRPLKATADEEIEMFATYSFANSPMLLAPAAFQVDNQIVVDSKARFANACLADQGIEAYYVDRPPTDGDPHRVIIVKQRINPEGCPDIFQPVLRRIRIVSRSSRMLRKVHLLDHVFESKGRKEIPPPVSISISKSVRSSENDSFETTTAQPLAGVTAQLPTLKSVSIPMVSRGEGLLKYEIELVVDVPKGWLAHDTYALQRYETRIGLHAREETPVIDWLIVLPIKGSITNKMETTPITFKFIFDGNSTVPRRLGIVNPFSKHTNELFIFFQVN